MFPVSAGAACFPHPTASTRLNSSNKTTPFLIVLLLSWKRLSLVMPVVPSRHHVHLAASIARTAMSIQRQLAPRYSFTLTRHNATPVSYTHLTLPTKRIV